MPRCSSRFCNWALGGLISACKRGTVSDLHICLQECNTRFSEQISRATGILERNSDLECLYSAEIKSKTFERAGIVTGSGIWQSNLPVSSAVTNVRLLNGYTERRASYPLTGGSLFLTRNFASSASHVVIRRPRKTGSKSRIQPGVRTGFNLGSRIQSRSRKAEEVISEKRLSGALSSGRDVQSGLIRGKSQIGKEHSKPTQRSAKKRFFPAVRSARKLWHQSIGAKERGKPRPSGKWKVEESPNDDGGRIRRRKRIRPHPGDVTFKRGLDSDTPITVLPTPVLEQGTVEGNLLSANAKFRQIEPSRELLRQIEENLLGRRRLVEWRKAGFDPTRTAPLDDIPESKDRRAPIQETVFRRKLTFIAAAKIPSSFPSIPCTEIAFAGRSNVGKSSLINALARQWGLARISDKPGLTQSINFFTLGSELCLVDLPGYGFAFAKAQVKEEWEELVKEYVATRPNLKRVCLLVDAKWGLKSKDQELLQLMESSRTRYQIILTKTDVLPPLDLARRATQILQTLKDHRCLVQPLMMVSSKSGAGLPHLRASLARVVSGHSRGLHQGSTHI